MQQSSKGGGGGGTVFFDLTMWSLLPEEETSCCGPEIIYYSDIILEFCFYKVPRVLLNSSQSSKLLITHLDVLTTKQWLT